MIKAIIFDLDGTLVDSVNYHAQAWQEAFKKQGYDFPVEKIREQIGKDSQFLIEDLLPAEAADKLQTELADYHDKYYQENFLAKVKPFPQVKELFAAIRKDGTKTILASSAKAEMVEHYQKLIGIEDLTDGATSTDDVDKSKPEPQIFQSALEKLSDIDAKEVLVVGDSPYDAIAAGKIGLRTICVLTGGFERETLTKAGCIAIYPDPAALLDHYPQFLKIDEIG